jgi:hypothetical protein
MRQFDSIKTLASVNGPCVSIYMPTHKFGIETVSDSNHFNSLLHIAENELLKLESSQADVDQTIYKIRTLTSPHSFWQHRDQGLAIFATKELCVDFNLPFQVHETVAAANYFYLRQLSALFHKSASFFVLQLGKNHVALYQASDSKLSPIEHSDIPPSMEVALAHEDLERQLQMRSVGHGNNAFHGHGAGDEIDKAVLERFFRAVDHGVCEALRGETAPLILAAVPYFLPLYQSVSHYGNIVATTISNSSEQLSEAELYSEAWRLLEPSFSETLHRSEENLQQMNGTGLTVSDLLEIIEDAEAGRVDTLFLASTEPVTTGDEDMLNRAINLTLTHGGSVLSATSSTLGTSSAIALLRY